MKKYRISVDDCIACLSDVTRKKPSSIFDNEFFGYLKSVHDRFGACFCLNLFYDNFNSEGFVPAMRPFTLAEMPDKYKSEFSAASDWLKLSFHSRREYPANPYKYADYAEVYDDASVAVREILRFAGEKSLSKEATVHFWAATREGLNALKDCGFKVFYGCFRIENGNLRGSYYFDKDFVAAHPERAFTADGFDFRKMDILLNAYKDKKTLLRDLAAVTEAKEDFYELLMHEQYFYGNYSRYIPRYRDIIDAAAKYMQDNGYIGGFAD